MRQRLRQITWTASTLVSVAMPAMAAAEPATACGVERNNARLMLGGASAMAAGATGLELQGMQRSASWHVAKEADKGAVLQDPSSHLHGLGSYYLARSASRLFASHDCGERALNAAGRGAVLKGAAVAIVIGTTKEVVDGWYNGFSAMDLAVDAIGAGFAVAQAYVAPLRYVTPSLSVAPAAFSSNGVRKAAFDYSNQTLWLSANVHDMLPAQISRVWPSAMRVSAGRRAQSGGAANQFIVGLDLDAAALPGNNASWVKVKRALHNVRLPGPAVVMGAGGTKSVALYW